MRVSAVVAITLILGACRTAADREEEVAAGTVSLTWQCGDSVVTSRYEDDATMLELSYAGSELSLPLARSGSGARYADDEGNEFWSKGDSATFTRAGGERLECAVRRPE